MPKKSTKLSKSIKFDLIAAIKNGDLEKVKSSLEPGLDLNFVAEEAEGLMIRLLGLAIREGKSEILKLLIKAGARLDIPVVSKHAKSGSTLSYMPLALVIDRGRMDMFEILLKAGVDPNENVQISDNGRFITALGMASIRGEVDMVKMLLEAGANPNSPASRANFDSPERSNIHGSSEVEVLESLLEAGAGIDRDIMLKNLAKDIMLELNRYQSVLNKIVTIISEIETQENQQSAITLIENELNTAQSSNLHLRAILNSEIDDKGNRLGHLAQKKGLNEVVEFLFLQGADLTIQNQNSGSVMNQLEKRSFSHNAPTLMKFMSGVSSRLGMKSASKRMELTSEKMTQSLAATAEGKAFLKAVKLSKNPEDFVSTVSTLIPKLPLDLIKMIVDYYLPIPHKDNKKHQSSVQTRLEDSDLQGAITASLEELPRDPESKNNHPANQAKALDEMEEVTNIMTQAATEESLLKINEEKSSSEINFSELAPTPEVDAVEGQEDLARNSDQLRKKSKEKEPSPSVSSPRSEKENKDKGHRHR